MNNIEELSKPVAEVNSKYGDPEAFGERELNVLADIQKMPYRTKFYSQEYVDALIAQLEAAQKLNPLSVNVSELEATYIGDIRLHMAAISDWKSRAEKAEAELSAANEKLSKPVVLPSGYSVRAGHPINEGERNVMIPKEGARWLSRFDVEHAIRVAGFTVEGE
ncbi:hypothetical protein [Yersinia mollaretii]|uniref:hypothetical protein n=1 Tax=Yersinia mollaretii TaxID=33060 RepID=UPI0011A95B6C|nr:hypothetical protein [Yersinia mollaretii]